VGEQEIVPVATATETVSETVAVTGATPVGPVSDVHVSPCAIMATKWGLVSACPPEAFTRTLAATAAPEGTNGHP